MGERKLAHVGPLEQREMAKARMTDEIAEAVAEFVRIPMVELTHYSWNSHEFRYESEFFADPRSKCR